MAISIQTALRNTRTQLEEHSDAPHREAEWLLEHITGFSRTQLRMNELQILSEQLVAQLNELTQRRIGGEPLAYILGEQHFWTLRLKVNASVLIPRPETELVIERALHHLPQNHPSTALDLGTGSGAIALALASERPATRVVATDYSTAALEVARCNARLNHLNNVELLHSNWFNHVPPQRFSLILSNPPYIAENDPHVAKDVAQHEPHLALFSGSDGLDSFRQIISRASDFLTDQGWLVLEHGWQQASAVREMLELAGFSSVASHADLAGHPRVTEGQWQISNPITSATELQSRP